VKNYKNFSVANFISDEYFQSWILYPNAESNAFWNSFLENHPEKKAEFDEACRMLRTITQSNYSLSPGDIAALWVRIKSDFEKSESLQQPRSKKYYWTVAAAIVGLIVLSFFFNRRQQTIEYHTAFGETKRITLPDSSTVILNANSRITYANNWSKSAVREVSLEGEAYFSVAHKKNNQPFRVSVDNGVGVEVLGTTFDIYHRTVDTKVVLNTGKIRLTMPDARDHKILMSPGDLVQLKKNNVIKRKVNARQYMAWTEHKIILDETTLGDMVRLAQDNYGVTVEVTPQTLLEQTVSGSMPSSNNAADFVAHMARIFQLKLHVDNNTYLITE